MTDDDRYADGREIQPVMTLDEFMAFSTRPEVMHEARLRQHTVKVAENLANGIADASDRIRECGDCGQMTSAERPGYLNWGVHADCFRERERRALDPELRRSVCNGCHAPLDELITTGHRGVCLARGTHLHHVDIADQHCGRWVKFHPEDALR